MSTETFTTEEIAPDTSGSVSVLLRFLREVPILRALTIPNAIGSIIAAAGYQAFVWMSGKLAECQSGACEGLEYLEKLRLPLSLSSLAGVALVVFLCRLVQWVVFESGSQLASQGLFRRMIRGVGHVRTTFFDEYPSGKIINRLAKDSDQLRVFAPTRLGDATSAIIELLIVAGIIAVASPLAALVVIPAFGSFLYIQRNIAPMLQRAMTLRSIRFGEVLHRESDVIEGVRSFELYSSLPALFGRLSQAMYAYMQMHFLRGRIEAWGRFWADIMVAVYGSLTLVAVYVGIHYGELSAVFGVVIMTATFRLGALFGWLTWSLGLLFESAGHARRVFEYVDLPTEETEEGIRPPKTLGLITDNDGDLSFTNYTMSYRQNTPEILQNLTVRIARHSKVGLVGRTGAGKTSLVQSLFRMVYVRDGDIRIGGQSLFHLPVEEARSFFAIIPQDPYLFEGTVRSNLDRYDEWSDSDLSDTLAKVQLSLQLSLEIKEGGTNLSLGQRQLLCLARVLLSKRPFVIMDEPTSGVDTITDSIMQNVLRTHLADRTILTIAHRLDTLTHMDRIIELRDGAIARDGHPASIIPLLTEAELA